ncbi:hypothetical protein TWF506_006533 [Arthrobotrys conoides]|uniref:Uncharacterized protein n=1 Tax=Arthrobotrys conoides TaxID=74498 RepID=A0AAN8NM70_9PEZI
MWHGNRKRPTGDARYHQYHIQEHLARVRHSPNTNINTPSPVSRQRRNLQSLPTELLIQIFSYLLLSSGRISIGGYILVGYDPGPNSTTFEFVNPATCNKLYISNGLFLTSRRISDIALHVLYSLNEFSINLEHRTLIRSWLLSIGESNRNRLTQLQFYGIMRTNENELLKIGSSLQTMQRLRRIHYKPGSNNNPKVATHVVEFDISPDEIPHYSKTIMRMYSTKGLPATLRHAFDLSVPIKYYL